MKSITTSLFTRTLLTKVGSKSNNNNNTMLEFFTTLASSLASFMLIWAMLKEFIPYELRNFIEKRVSVIYSYFHSNVEIKIPESTGDRLKRSDAYISVQAYLSSISANTSKRLVAEIEKNGTNIVLAMDEGEKIKVEYKGIRLTWVLCKLTPASNNSQQCSDEKIKKYFKVTFHKKYREVITKEYLQYVVQMGKEIRMQNRQRRLYTNAGGYKWYGCSMWSHTHFEHPATFNTVAMDTEKKKEIIDDLVKFSKSKDFYARTGKAWKRGYLLYGPPGTGKSTLIAAMANLLGYDIYDLELTAVIDNSDLRKLLIEITSKSIIVIEDIDCSLDLTGQRSKHKEGEEGGDGSDSEGSKKGKKKDNVKVTLSGLLNFIDGIWSSCGGERIIVFTTNYVEKLDPALIRRGRMDKHIEMAYCTFEGFKVLARNYLFIEDDHVLFDEIAKLLSEVKITPADVAENLMPLSSEEDVEVCLKKLIKALVKAKADSSPVAGSEKAGEEEAGE